MEKKSFIHIYTRRENWKGDILRPRSSCLGIEDETHIYFRNHNAEKKRNYSFIHFITYTYYSLFLLYLYLDAQCRATKYK